MTDTEAKALALVSIDPKALEHACLCAGRSVHHFDRMGDDLPLRASIVAHARAIEQHEAFKREVSDELAKLGCWPDTVNLQRFIIPAPDPLVEAVNEAWGWRNPHPDVTENLRAAMQARGYEWRKIEHAPPAGGSDAE